MDDVHRVISQYGSQNYLIHKLLFCIMWILSLAGVSTAHAQTGDEAPLKTHDGGEDWPQFLGPRQDGSSLETGILTEWPETGPVVVWTVSAGTGYGAVAIAKRKCFVFDRDRAVERLRCLDATTGQAIWSYEHQSRYVDSFGFDNGPRCSPVVDDSRVYVYGAEGKLVCINVGNGDKIWSFDANQEFGVVQNFFGVGSTPVVEGDKLLVMVGGSPPGDQSIPPGQLDRVEPNDSCFVAFDKRTGQVLYRTGNDLASYSSLRVMDWNQRRLAVALARDNLIGFDVETGKIQFEFSYRAKKLESVNASTVLIRGDELFVTESYELGGCRLKLGNGTPKVIWRDPARRRREQSMACHWMTPVVHKGFLYGCSGESNGDAELRCVDWETGEIRWSEAGLARHSILLVDDHLLIVNEFGKMWLVKTNPDKFEVVAQSDNLVSDGQPLLEKPVWAAPVLSHGLLYLRGANRLVCARLMSPR